MLGAMTVQVLLDKYRELVDQGKVQFLKEDPEKEDILGSLRKLQDVMKNERKPSFEWYEAHDTISHKGKNV